MEQFTIKVGVVSINFPQKQSKIGIFEFTLVILFSMCRNFKSCFNKMEGKQGRVSRCNMFHDIK